MLNILWVEDEYTEEKKFQWFGNRDVILKTDFDAAEAAIKLDFNQYDVVVLDINLENSEYSSNVNKYAHHFRVAPKEFLEKAGMNLYFMLIENGFPKEHIVFLTANANAETSHINDIEQLKHIEDEAVFREVLENLTRSLDDEQKRKAFDFLAAPDGYDEEDIGQLCDYLKSITAETSSDQDKNTYENLQDIARQCRIDVPKACLKGTTQLEAELRKFETNKYLILRRGIIQGSLYLKQLIDENESSIQFRDFIKHENKQPIIEIPTNEIINYLDVLIAALDIRMPRDDNSLNNRYRLFLRTLCHEWEENIKNIKHTYTFPRIMKMTRNWVAHAKLLEPLNAQFIAFLFLINMRAMFRLPEATQAYEQTLLNCISLSPAKEISITTLQDKIKLSEENVDNLLIRMNNIHTDDESNVILTYVEKKENKTKILKCFNDKINEIYRYNTGQIDAEDHGYKRFLLQYFWINQKSDSSNLTANSDNFLPTLARHIYNDSF